MDVGAARVTDGEVSEAGGPGQGALDHPAVAAEAVRALDAAACDVRGWPAPNRGSGGDVTLSGWRLPW